MLGVKDIAFINSTLVFSLMHLFLTETDLDSVVAEISISYRIQKWSDSATTLITMDYIFRPLLMSKSRVCPTLVNNLFRSVSVTIHIICVNHHFKTGYWKSGHKKCNWLLKWLIPLIFLSHVIMLRFLVNFGFFSCNCNLGPYFIDLSMWSKA